MKEKGRSRALHKKPYGLCKRFLAAMIAAVMVTTNIGTDLTTAYAAESSDSVTFEMSGSGLVTAIEEAIAAGNPLQEGDIDFTNGRTEQFEALFYGEGNIYEIYPEYDGGDMDAELRVFVRLPEDADDMYMVTGDEEIIFLYVNNGESSISCSTSITRMEDGKEKVKRTKKLTVKSYEAAFGDEEVNIISKPAETVPSETGPSETIPAETIPAETEPAETAPSEEIPTEAVPSEPDPLETTSSEANPAESEPAEPTLEETTEQTSQSQETQIPAGEEGQKETTASPTEGTDTGRQDTEEAQKESEGSRPENTDKSEEIYNNAKEEVEQKGDADKEQIHSEKQDDTPVASINRHYAPVVAVKTGDETASLPEKHDSDVRIEEGTKEKEEPKENAKADNTTKETAENQGSSADKTSGKTNVSSETGTSGSKESSGNQESSASQESSGNLEPSGSPEPSGTPESSGGAETPSQPAHPSGSEPSGESGDSKETEEGKTEESSPTESTGDIITDETPVITIETEPSRTPEETEAEDVHKVKAATSDDLVGIGYCSTARVYTTTVNTLKALNDFEGYKVTYAVYSQGTARIVDGPRGIEEGGSLTFGVKTQVGYDIQSVSANGEILETGAPGDSADPDSADPGNLAEDISWFTIEDVTDELEIEVYTTETDEHPEFSDTIVVNDGMIINLYAPEGVLPKGVTASAERVDSALEDSIRENAQEAASEEGKQVSSVAAYDINLWLGSQKLDAGIWNQEGAVTVTFSGIPVEEASQTAEEMSIVHVETEAAGVKALEEVRDAVDVSGGRAVDALSFEAEHFSIYAVISKENITRTTVEVSKDETFRVKADRRYEGSWFVSDPRVVSIQNVKDINENGNGIQQRMLKR